jgi:hypothetical protein
LLFLACGFVAVAALALGYLGFHASPLLRDYAMVARARAEGFGLMELVGRFTNSFLEFAGLLVCAALVPLTWNPDADSRQEEFAGRRPLFFALLVSVLGLALLFTNWQNSGLPLNGAFAVILASEIAAGRPKGPGAVEWKACAAVIAMALMVALAPLFNDAVGLGHALWSSHRLQTATTSRFSAPPLASFVVPGRFGVGESGFVARINDGIELARHNSAPNESIASLDFANPFGFALQRPAFRGGSTAMQWSFTYSDAHKPDPEWLLGGADVVMVPKHPALPIEPLMRNYGEFLRKRFRLAGESDEWYLYRRVG